MRAFDLPALEPLETTLLAAAAAPPAPGAFGTPAAAPPVPAVDLEAEAAAAREAGFAAGLAEAHAQLAPALEALQAAAAAVAAEREAVAAAAEPQAVELALRIAEQVVHGAIDVQPELVLGAVTGALRRLLERERVTVLVHPDDLELVRSAAPGLQSELGGIEHLEVQAERRVARGGAVVRTGEGEVDASLEAKFARAREVVAEALRG